MKIVFHSNYMNHHQRYFIASLIQQGCTVTFVSHEELPFERKAMGYTTEMMGGTHIQYTEETADQVHKLTMEADAVIFGSKPAKLFRDRVHSGKLTFNYSERLFKKNTWKKLLPFYIAKLRKTYLFDKEHIPYVLAAGAYATQDYKCLGYPHGYFLKWGYFPPLTSAALSDLLPNKREKSIIWVSRFIDWKHPEYVVQLGKYLKKKSIPFQIKMIGTGPLLEATQKMIDDNRLSEHILIVGGLPPEQVRKEFEAAQIALLTSGRQEGWGAVVNEAMNSACATVTSHMVGSATYLVRNRVNGMIFKNKKQMFNAVEQLLQDQMLCNQLGANAYNTVSNLWNHQIAAERLVNFIKNRTVQCTDGPMSLD